MLLDVLTQSDVETQQTFCTMLCDLARGLVHPSVRKRIVAGAVIALPKPDGGVRPIALGEVFVKMATRIVLEASATALAKRFRGIQYGVSYSGGAEYIVHSTRAFMRTMSTDGCVVTVDFKNAFNSPSREAMWQACRDFPHLASLFALEYECHSTLRCRGLSGVPHIPSERGSRQGTTAGPAFFCLALHPVLEEVAKIDGVTVLAYMDDVSLLCTSHDAARKAWAMLSERALALGLVINAKKCELLRHPSAGAEPVQFLDKNIARATSAGCLKLLGASVGVTDRAEKAHLTHRFSSFATFFRRLRLCLGPHGSALLAAAGVPKVNYLLRTHDAPVTLSVAGSFDGEVRKTWCEWAQCDADDVSRAFAHLPTSMGGLGFTSAEQTAKAAYDASLMQALHSADAAIAGDSKQRALVNVVNTALAKWLDGLTLANDPKVDVARHRALNSAPGTASLFRDPTARARYREWSAAMRHRLLAPLSKSPEAVCCSGCSTTMTQREFLLHAAGCSQLRGFNASSRHASLKLAVKQLLHDAGIQFLATEPRHLRKATCPGCQTVVVEEKFAEHARTCTRYDERTMERPRGGGPDILVVNMPGSTKPFTALDVTCVSLGTAAAAERNSAPETLFRARETQKIEKYGADCAANDVEFVVIAVSECGQLSDATRRFVDRIAAKTDTSPWPLRTYLQAQMLAATGLALHNAETRSGLCHVRKTDADVPLGSLRLQVGADGAAAPLPWLHPATEAPVPTRAAPAAASASDAAPAPAPAAGATPTPVPTTDAAPSTAQRTDTPNTPPPVVHHHHHHYHHQAPTDGAASQSTTPPPTPQHGHHQQSRRPPANAGTPPVTPMQQSFRRHDESPAATYDGTAPRQPFEPQSFGAPRACDAPAAADAAAPGTPVPAHAAAHADAPAPARTRTRRLPVDSSIEWVARCLAAVTLSDGTVQFGARVVRLFDGPLQAQAENLVHGLLSGAREASLIVGAVLALMEPGSDGYMVPPGENVSHRQLLKLIGEHPSADAIADAVRVVLRVVGLADASGAFRAVGTSLTDAWKQLFFRLPHLFASARASMFSRPGISARGVQLAVSADLCLSVMSDAQRLETEQRANLVVPLQQLATCNDVASVVNLIGTVSSPSTDAGLAFVSPPFDE